MHSHFCSDARSFIIWLLEDLNLEINSKFIQDNLFHVDCLFVFFWIYILVKTRSSENNHAHLIRESLLGTIDFGHLDTISSRIGWLKDGQFLSSNR